MPIIASLLWTKRVSEFLKLAIMFSRLYLMAALTSVPCLLHIIQSTPVTRGITCIPQIWQAHFLLYVKCSFPGMSPTWLFLVFIKTQPEYHFNIYMYIHLSIMSALWNRQGTSSILIFNFRSQKLGDLQHRYEWWKWNPTNELPTPSLVVPCSFHYITCLESP